MIWFWFYNFQLKKALVIKEKRDQSADTYSNLTAMCTKYITSLVNSTTVFLFIILRHQISAK